jgi:hypothetical protein
MTNRLRFQSGEDFLKAHTKSLDRFRALSHQIGEARYA